MAGTAQYTLTANLGINFQETTVQLPTQASEVPVHTAVNYVKGCDVPIGEALSRVSLQQIPGNDQIPEMCVHHVTQNLPASPTRRQQIRDETTRDPKDKKENNVPNTR